jgi:hypothetical protein
MLKKPIVIIVLFFISNIAIAQDNKKVKKDNTLHIPKNTFSLKVHPLAAIDFLDPNLMLGVEYRISERVATVVNLGYIYFSNYYRDKTGANGFIIRPAIRYYASENKRFFLEAELHFKKLTYKMYDWLGMNCVNNVPTFNMLTNFDYIKRVMGFNAKVGRVSRLSKNSNKVSLEYFTGLGIKIKKIYLGKSVPENSCYNITDFFNINDSSNNNVLYPNFCLGLTLFIQL